MAFSPSVGCSVRLKDAPKNSAGLADDQIPYDGLSGLHPCQSK
jgi:hypothetical protein